MLSRKLARVITFSLSTQSVELSDEDIELAVDHSREIIERSVKNSFNRYWRKMEKSSDLQRTMFHYKILKEMPFRVLDALVFQSNQEGSLLLQHLQYYPSLSDTIHEVSTSLRNLGVRTGRDFPGRKNDPFSLKFILPGGLDDLEELGKLYGKLHGHFNDIETKKLKNQITYLFGSIIILYANARDGHVLRGRCEKCPRFIYPDKPVISP